MLFREKFDELLAEYLLLAEPMHAMLVIPWRKRDHMPDIDAVAEGCERMAVLAREMKKLMEDR